MEVPWEDPRGLTDKDQEDDPVGENTVSGFLPRGCLNGMGKVRLIDRRAVFLIYIGLTSGGVASSVSIWTARSSVAPKLMPQGLPARLGGECPHWEVNGESEKTTWDPDLWNKRMSHFSLAC